MISPAALRSADQENRSLTTSSEVRHAWLEQQEIAVLDVREEAFYAEAHPLFAANLPLSRIELDAYTRLPRRSVPIVIFDGGEGYDALAATRLSAMGYTNVSLLADGLQGWRNAGFEIFRDVNSPSKAFGELVEVVRHTPSLSASEVKQLIDDKADIMIVDARRYEEFQTMSIPTASSAPGGELVLRLQPMTERPATQIIVNCAGRTRSILGTQSLINAGLPNPVMALRNGTIGWKLAQQHLDYGATREVPPPNALSRAKAANAARKVADDAGVRRTSLKEVESWRREGARTIYLFDVRTPEEYAAGHLSQFRSAPGGQLVQETDMFAPVRGARIVLMDDDGARANMSSSWLAQMNWEVYVADGIEAKDLISQQQSSELPTLPTVPESAKISPQKLKYEKEHAGITVLDFSRSRDYLKGHISGAMFALRSRLDEVLTTTAESAQYVVTSSEAAAAQLAWDELSRITSKPVYLLNGGNQAWQAAGYPLDRDLPAFACQPVDYYQRPYEGTEASDNAMQAYLDWEYGLVDQLERDGTHGFKVLR